MTQLDRAFVLLLRGGMARFVLLRQMLSQGTEMHLSRRRRKKYFLCAWVVSSGIACGVLAVLAAQVWNR